MVCFKKGENRKSFSDPAAGGEKKGGVASYLKGPSGPQKWRTS